MRQPAAGASGTGLSRAKSDDGHQWVAGNAPWDLAHKAHAQLDAPLWHLIGDGCESSHAVEVKARTAAWGSWSGIRHHGLSALAICSRSLPSSSPASSDGPPEKNSLTCSSRSWFSMQRRRISPALSLWNGLIPSVAPRTIL